MGNPGSQVVGRKFRTTEMNNRFAKWINRIFDDSRYGIECPGCAMDGKPGEIARLVYRRRGASGSFRFDHGDGRGTSHTQFPKGNVGDDEDRGVIQTLRVIPRPPPNISKI